MARPSKLAHVVYMTRRFDEMLSWYTTVFEARVQCQNPAFAFLTYDDEHHRFAFVNMSVLNPDGVEMDATSKVGVNHVGYTFSSPGVLLENYERLKQAGNRMEFQVDCCANAEEAHAYMHSDAFAANPVGVEIDPDVLLVQYRSGASAEKLLAMPVGPPSPIPTEHGM